MRARLRCPWDDMSEVQGIQECIYATWSESEIFIIGRKDGEEGPAVAN